MNVQTPILLTSDVVLPGQTGLYDGGAWHKAKEGGEVPNAPELAGGSHIEPTDVTMDMTIARKEIFGPRTAAAGFVWNIHINLKRTP